MTDDGTAPGSAPTSIAGYVRGTCRICGAPARSNGAYYCAEHRPLKKSGSSSRKHRAPKAPGSTRPVGRPRSLSGDIENLYLMFADLWEISSPDCADALRDQAPKIGEAWEAKAKQDARVRAMLEGLTGSAGWAGLALVHVPIMRAVVGAYVLPAARARATPGPAGAGAPPLDPAALALVMDELALRWPGLTNDERLAEHAQATAFNVVLPLDRFPVA